MRIACLLLVLLFVGPTACRTGLPTDQLTVNREAMDLDELERRLDLGTLAAPGDPLEVRYPRDYTRAELDRLIDLVKDAVQARGGGGGPTSIKPHERD